VRPGVGISGTHIDYTGERCGVPFHHTGWNEMDDVVDVRVA
jgi:hypothetical protein